MASTRRLTFDARHNIFSNILWIKSKGAIATHKRSGMVVMLCLEGSMRYLEYDWVGTYCREHDLPLNRQLCL